VGVLTSLFTVYPWLVREVELPTASVSVRVKVLELGRA
jgi:hypothetical protein